MGTRGHITNSYIIEDTSTTEALLIDPAYNAEYIIDMLKKLEVKLKIIYLTHCHGDHISALEDLYNEYREDVKILIHENDKEGVFDYDKNCKYIIGEPNFTNLNLSNIDTVKDKDIVKLGNIYFEVIHTPGHTNGCSLLYIHGTNILITGDTIFSDCHGRTDLKSGSKIDMKESLNKVFSRFENETIYPGHGFEENIRNVKNRICFGL